MGAVRNRHFEVDLIPGTNVVSVTRSGRAFETLDEVEESWTEVNDALDAYGRERHALLVDTRAAPPRNDPEFEEVFSRHRRRMLSGFPSMAVLVRTSVGRLQVERHAREDGTDLRVFTDENEAVHHLRRT